MEIPSWAIDQGAKIIDYALSKSPIGKSIQKIKC